MEVTETITIWVMFTLENFLVVLMIEIIGIVDYS